MPILTLCSCKSAALCSYTPVTLCPHPPCLLRLARRAGFITREMIAQRLPPPGPDTLVLRCGPPPMNDAMKGHLDALGYAEEAQFQF